MPIVPTYKHEENQRDTSSVSSVTNTAAIQDEGKEYPSDFSVRMELAGAVREETARQGSVSTSFLDHFAMTHFDTKGEDSPVLCDYAVLRRAAQQESIQEKRQEQREQLQQEATWVSQVGALSPDASALDAYLKIQIPAYISRLEQAGLSPEQAQASAKNLRAETIEKNILRSLATEDWQTSQQVFQAQRSFLHEQSQQRLSEKIRHTFARSEAQRLWQQAQLQSRQVNTPAKELAFSFINEPDDDLRSFVQQEIVRLEQADKQQKAAKQAEVFTRLAQNDTALAQQLLDVQTVLEEADVHQARQAVARLHEPASERQQEWFVEHYFKASALNPEQAFEKGLCGARDYFHLQAARLREQSGQDTAEEKWLCRGIAVWMKRQGFDAKDITQSTYAVLTGAADTKGRAAVWQKMKTLLTC